MRIVISAREALKYRLHPDKYDFLARTTDETGDVFAFVKKYADYIVDMSLMEFKVFLVECNQLYQAGFFGNRWDEMLKILMRHRSARKPQ